MKFLIGKYDNAKYQFVNYTEMDFPSVEQAKKWCRNQGNSYEDRFVYFVVRGMLDDKREE